ncbi:carboxypeptidase Q-like [Homalodisca vitripennis]|nr:carboxypeptidase Q-like [Homalodisca vitripennis]
MMESDEGTFTPFGLEYMGSDEGGCIIKEILKLMEPINATQFKNSSDVGSDITVWANEVPLLSNLNDNGRYFWFHHSNGDTMTVLSPDDLDKNTALWAATAYILADISVDLPKPAGTKT